MAVDAIGTFTTSIDQRASRVNLLEDQRLTKCVRLKKHVIVLAMTVLPESAIDG